MQALESMNLTDEQAVAPTVAELIGALNDGDINYCVWKSSFEISDILSGNDDLDILVSRSERLTMENTLNSLGYRRVKSSYNKAQCGMDDYYSFDIDSQKFIHLQVYYQLIFGERLVENFHFPIEQKVLQSATKHPSGLRIISAENELLIF